MKKKIGVASFVALMALGMASVLQGVPNGSTAFDDNYYSDSTFATQVGERYMECNDSMHGWGTRTAYKDSYEWDCQAGQQVVNDCTSGFYICNSYEAPGSYFGCDCVV